MAFRLNQDEHDLISWAAQARGMTTSEYVRTSALERAGIALIEADTKHEQESA